MQNLIDRISKIEAAANSIREKAEAEKLLIDGEIKEERKRFDKALSEREAKALSDIRAEKEAEAKKALLEQREKAEEKRTRIEGVFKEKHGALSEAITERIIKG